MPPDRKLDPQKRCGTLETANIPGILHSTQNCAHAEWALLCANLEKLTCTSGFPGQNADWDKYIQLHYYWVMHPQQVGGEEKVLSVIVVSYLDTVSLAMAEPDASLYSSVD